MARGLGRLVALLERGLATDEDADELFALGRRTFGLSSFGAGDESEGPPRIRGESVPWHWMARYFTLAEEDPSLPLLMQGPPGAWFVVRQGPGENRSGPMFPAFRAAGLDDAAMTMVQSAAGSRHRMFLYRDRGMKPFSADELALFRLLYPRFAAAFGARRALAAPGEPHAFIGYPRHTVEWSPSARELWQRRLGPLDRSGWARLERALLRCAAELHARGPGAPPPLLPGLVRVELAAVPPRRGEARRTLALFRPAAPQPPASLAALTPSEELLSPRERLVARRAAAGHTVAEIAAALRVSPETVRTHLKRVRTKLCISTRADLAALVAR